MTRFYERAGKLVNEMLSHRSVAWFLVSWFWWPRRLSNPLKVIVHQNLIASMSLHVTNKMKTSWLIAVVLFFVGAGSSIFGQVPVESPQPLASPSASPTPSPGETGRPLYGLQGVLIETLDGKVVSSQSENEQFNPASTMKLATALVALRTLGPDHRFATGVWTDGVLDKATGIITGNLYISCRDPSFHYEHGVLLAR